MTSGPRPHHKPFTITPDRLAVIVACRDLLRLNGHPPGPAAIARLNGTRAETVARQLADLRGYGFLRGTRLTDKAIAALAAATTGGSPVAEVA